MSDREGDRTARVTGRRAAAGAVAAQFSQALASFLLTVAAVRTLPASDFGVLALLLGTLVLATGLMTGFVGDSLTVLDRAAPRLRAGLQVWCAAISGGLGVVGATAGWATGLLAARPAVVFGLALAAFVVEEIARRLLMATLRFWSIVIVDVSYLAAAAAVLAAAGLGRGPLVLVDYLAALLVGQALATVVAVALLPSAERRLAPWRPAALRQVAAFGAWRAAQQAIRPASLTVMRAMVLAAAGRAALGGVEAARVYMSPGLLLVAGTGGFLLATSARTRTVPIRQAVRTADRAAITLVTVNLAFSASALVLLPWLGPLVTGTAITASAAAVGGWALFNIAAAATMPYVSLAAVRGRQNEVVLLRVADTALSFAFVAFVLLADGSAELAPYAMGAGGFVGAGLQRFIGLRRTAEPVAGTAG